MSNLRKDFLERLAPCVRNRVKVFWTTYPHEQERAAFLIDGQEILQVYDHMVYRELHYNPGSLEEQMLAEREIINSSFFIGAVLKFSTLSREQALASTNPVIRAFALLDKRVGKRALLAQDARDDSRFVQRLLRLRLESEGMQIPEYLKDGLITDRIKPQFTEVENDQEKRNEEFQNTLTLSNTTRDIGSLLAALKQSSETEVDTAVSFLVKEIYTALDNDEGRVNFHNCLEYLERNSDLLDMTDLKRMKAVCHLAREKKHWLRPLTLWQSASHNADKQLASLLRHLFCHYEIPAFMDSAWSEEEDLHRQWYRHLGAGKNIRTTGRLPINLTSSMAHHFLQAPAHYSINAALRYGQILALDGSPAMADACGQTRLVDDFQHDEFSLSFFRFLAANPMLDPAWVGPIVDFLWQQKFEDRLVHLQSGEVRNLGPESANLTLKGRTVESLLKQVERWHAALGIGTKGKQGDVTWAPSATVKQFTFEEGTKEKLKTWRIRELLSTQSLRQEGTALKHCVVSYAQSCRSGQTTIWSLTDNEEKTLTIEVSPKLQKIRQVRGLRNRQATAKEKEIISRWAQVENLEYL